MSYAAGSNPFSVAVGDFDGDTDLDLAVANQTSDNVSILLNNGDGTFAAAVSYAAGTNPWSVAVGDFDGDTDLDLAIPNINSADVSILLGNGDGTFAAAVSYGAGTNPTSVAVGDFDGDTDLDLAVANNGTNDASILLGHGDGTFGSAVSNGVGDTAFSVAAGDFDGDADLDLAVANQRSNNVSILLGNGDGTFAAAVSYGGGLNVRSVAVGDFDGDTDLDLALADQAVVSILLNSCGCANGAVDPDTGECEPGLPQGDRCGEDGECSTDFCVDGVCCEVASCPAEESCQRFSGLCAPPGDCVGDCNGNGEVVIGELVTGVNVGLGHLTVDACPAFDPDEDGLVAINELVLGVTHALSRCPASPLSLRQRRSTMGKLLADDPPKDVGRDRLFPACQLPAQRLVDERLVTLAGLPASAGHCWDRPGDWRPATHPERG